MQELRTWLDQALAQAPPKTAIGKALYYLQDEWPRLIRYLDDGGIPIDNNLAENAIRPFVVGRKNWLFSHSVKGVQASANLYSLVQVSAPPCRGCLPTRPTAPASGRASCSSATPACAPCSA